MASFYQPFLSTFLRRQNFDLPDSMIYYILMNPSSSKVYQKLIQCCKYFFIKNPILVFHCLDIDDDGWKICKNQGNCKEDEFDKTIDSRILSSCCKLWIDHEISIDSTDSSFASDFIPKIYKNNATRSFFENQHLSLQQFLFYAQNAVACILDNVIINTDVCAEIPLEEIIANLPNLLRIFIHYGPDSRNVSSNTVKKLLQIPHFNNLTKLHVVNASENFDIAPIYDHYKKNRSRFTFSVFYQNELSEVVAKKHDGIAKEILEYKFHDNETPLIGYPGQNIIYQCALRILHERSLLSTR